MRQVLEREGQQHGRCREQSTGNDTLHRCENKDNDAEYQRQDTSYNSPDWAHAKETKTEILNHYATGSRHNKRKKNTDGGNTTCLANHGSFRTPTRDEEHNYTLKLRFVKMEFTNDMLQYFSHLCRRPGISRHYRRRRRFPFPTALPG